MFVGEVVDVPRITTVDATPVRLGKSYFQYQAVTRIEAVVLACDTLTNDAASWHLQYAFAIVDPFNIPYELGSGIRTKQYFGGGAALWDVSIVATYAEPDDTPGKFWFEVTGQAATVVTWGGRARIWIMDMTPDPP